MPPLRPPSDSDSESDAPETISLSQSKKLIKQKNSEIRKAGALVRQRIKLKNREKDQKLKERAVLNQKDDKIPLRRGERREQVVLHESKDGSDDDNEDVDGSFDSDVEARMLRAMKDAEGEDEGEGSDSGDDGEFAEFQEGSSFDGDHAMNEDDEDEEMGHAELPSSDDDDTESPEQPQLPANYLPDEVFKAAFSQATKPKPSQLKKKTAALSAKQQKKYKRSGPKDIMVGSKAIRTLASTNKPVSATAAVPSSKINRFLNRTLALKGQRPVPGKGWERRPANIGVLRRNGPPAHFVRKQ